MLLTLSKELTAWTLRISEILKYRLAIEDLGSLATFRNRKMKILTTLVLGRSDERERIAEPRFHEIERG